MQYKIVFLRITFPISSLKSRPYFCFVYLRMTQNPKSQKDLGLRKFSMANFRLFVSDSWPLHSCLEQHLTQFVCCTSLCREWQVLIFQAQLKPKSLEPFYFSFSLFTFIGTQFLSDFCHFSSILSSYFLDFQTEKIWFWMENLEILTLF